MQDIYLIYMDGLVRVKWSEVQETIIYASCIKSISNKLAQSTLILCVLVPTINISIIVFCSQVFE